MAGGSGLEPEHADPKSAVLPLKLSPIIEEIGKEVKPDGGAGKGTRTPDMLLGKQPFYH